MREDPEVLAYLHSYFRASWDTDSIRRALVTDPAFRVALQALVHPKVVEESERWFSLQRSVYAIKESALLLSVAQSLDVILYVEAQEVYCIQRARMRTPQVAEETLRALYLLQSSSSDLADHTIYNNPADTLLPQVWRLHRLLSQAA